MPHPRITPMSFDAAEIDGLREMKESRTPRVCPLCGGGLQCADFVARDGSGQKIWVLRCLPCNRVALLRDVTRHRH